MKKMFIPLISIFLVLFSDQISFTFHFYMYLENENKVLFNTASKHTGESGIHCLSILPNPPDVD